MHGTHYVLVFNFLVFSQANKAKDDSLNLLKDHGPGHSRVMFLYILPYSRVMIDLLFARLS